MKEWSHGWRNAARQATSSLRSSQGWDCKGDSMNRSLFFSTIAFFLDYRYFFVAESLGGNNLNPVRYFLF